MLNIRSKIWRRFLSISDKNIATKKEPFFEIDVLKNFAIFIRKHMCWILFNKAADLKACNFIKKKLKHMCFPVNLDKFLRTAFLIEQLRWLVLILNISFLSPVAAS